VDVVGSGWSEGKRMSVRVTRKVGHPRRLREFGRDLLCSGDTGEEVWCGAMKQGGSEAKCAGECVGPSEARGGGNVLLAG
jgi:hypothetical protein